MPEFVLHEIAIFLGPDRDEHELPEGDSSAHPFGEIYACWDAAHIGMQDISPIEQREEQAYQVLRQLPQGKEYLIYRPHRLP